MRSLRREARRALGSVRYVSKDVVSFAEAWAAATTDEERRDVVGTALEAVEVRRGRPGRGTREKAAERLS